jgi:hypothetical protein
MKEVLPGGTLGVSSRSDEQEHTPGLLLIET